MALTNLERVRAPNLAADFVWLTFRDGDQPYLVRISRADWDAVVGQAPRDALIKEQEETLVRVIEAKRDRGELAQEPMPNGTVINRIDLSRTDLQEGIKTTPVWMQSGSSPLEFGSQQSDTDTLGDLNIADPLRTGPQRQPEPQQPIMAPGAIGLQPSPVVGVAGVSLPVQSYLVTTPLSFPGGASLLSLTLRFGEGLHNRLPEHLAAALAEDFEGWRRVPVSRSELLDLLSTVGTEPNQALREAIIDALNHRAAALQFSEPRSLRVSDFLTGAGAVTAYSALGSDALVVVALAGGCFVLIQVFLGLATVTNYGITQIGTALVDRVAEKLRGRDAPPR